MRRWVLAPVPCLLPGLLLCLLAGGLASCTTSRNPEAPSASKPVPGGNGGPSTPTIPGQTLLAVSQVDVLVMESFPPQIVAKIEGNLPDGCSEVGEITQRRTDKTIDVTITVRRTTAGACIAIAPQVSRSVRLDGSFAESGTYTVRVNGVAKTFTL